ncbi:MAG: J domain-containing protein [Actinomycetota bacterium]|nr:J domain-containing protein [Actinomycetota bacterium]
MSSSHGDHYRVLGLAPGASDSEIRNRYRELARHLHPDRSGAKSSDGMAELNEAYRVLSDPTRRADYDRGRRSESSTSPVVRSARPTIAQVVPARFPWRFVVVLAGVGSTAVLVSAALAPSSREMGPDGVIQAGSCVEVDATGFAREVSCTGTESDLVVENLVPTDSVCSDGAIGYLDRLGLGRVCLKQQ